MILMQLVSDAFGRPMAQTGQYLQAFDFEAGDGVGVITMTRNPREAMHFEDLHAAFAFIKRTPECRPTRADGKPNRPLSATTWTSPDIDKVSK